SPSIVVTLAPSFMMASVRQELMRRPSTRTVHAPHWPWSHPFFVPVKPTYSRSASSSVVHGATSSLNGFPLMTNEIVLVGGNPVGAPVATLLAGAVSMRSSSSLLKSDGG